MRAINSESGVTLITVLVCLFLLAAGISTLFRVLPLLDHLSRRSQGYVACTQLAEKIFQEVEEKFGQADGPEVPAYLEGTDADSPGYFYRLWFQEEKEGLYGVSLEITWKTRGKLEKRHFYDSFIRR
ncbi:MAG: hypothetical protein NC911_03560 [Candidatus Omnitrophica bacterium]|nr:hypothetical protein [Candidatus Omnitrophota bacterium]